MKYIRGFFTFFGIWFIAASFNGVLSGISIGLFESGSLSGDAIGISILCSFLFSIPLVGAVWLVAVILQLTGMEGREFFRMILAAAIIGGLAGAVLFIVVLGGEFKSSQYAVALCIIISAISAVLFFRNQLIGDESPAAEEDTLIK